MSATSKRKSSLMQHGTVVRLCDCADRLFEATRATPVLQLVILSSFRVLT